MLTAFLKMWTLASLAILLYLYYEVAIETENGYRYFINRHKWKA